MKIREGEISLIFLYPLENLKEIDPKKINETSIVAKLEFGKNTFLFTGDITQKVKDILISKYPELLKAKVFKIPRHGAKGSISL